MVTDDLTSDIFSDSSAIPAPSSPATPTTKSYIPPQPHAQPLDFSSPLTKDYGLPPDDDEPMPDASQAPQPPAQAIASETTEDPIRQAKTEWVKSMRLKFCVRKEFDVTKNIIYEDGTLNQDYFRPPKGTKLQPEESRKWTDTERALLIKGIEKHGIGHFKNISDESLPAWSTNDLRLRTIRLIGRQNLQLYRDWKGNEDAIMKEYERNKEIGLRFGTWKQGVLVYDDEGLVEAAIREGDEKGKRKRT
ncbi:hypothetical protein HK097_001296 [Rhizophlyctis rosea]|uniref:Myb-like domain-containing protein n=1 Tax=Rhizophlyctis rosea TaxID=64517 RepID=A0AAD5S7F2_9FUNG|nr:hypothetical protein HK097_001296 [Rhizophlyctis rosea]